MNRRLVPKPPLPCALCGGSGYRMAREQLTKAQLTISALAHHQPVETINLRCSNCAGTGLEPMQLP